MRTTKLILNRSIFFLALLPLAACAAGAQVVYVDCCAPGPGHDGTTWDTAFLTIQEGVDAATPGGEVWVADGVYVENLVMGEGVAIYGGFLGAEPGGYETERHQRDYENNITTIDGNQSGSCVVMAVDARVDGFTVTNGSGTLGDYDAYYGGGFLCNGLGETGVIVNDVITANSANAGAGILCTGGSSPTITHNKIAANSAYGSFSAGGGIYCRNSSCPVVIGNTITGNSADDYGGGICCAYDSSPVIARNIITANSAGNGGGVSCWASSPIVTDNTITDNSANIAGGIECYYYSSPTLANNTIASNASVCGGGIECGLHSSPIVANSVVTANVADLEGGGIRCDRSSAPVLVHNDFWENAPDDYYGCQPGEGDISADPLFVDPEAGDYHLLPDSPCIDAGCNDYVFSDEDFDGDPRVIWAMRFPVPYWPHPGYVDIGADEYVPPAAGPTR